MAAAQKSPTKSVRARGRTTKPSPATPATSAASADDGPAPTSDDVVIPVGPIRGWTFLTNHAHALLCLAQNGSQTARELSLRIGITERSVQAILADLIADSYVTKAKIGRRNSYTVNRRGRLRHPLEAAHTVGDLIDALT